MADNNFEVVIIGGSYAGLSAAMALGRSLRKVLIVDSSKPCNRFTSYSHNFITQDGVSPAAISMSAKTQVKKYKTISFLNDYVTEANKTNLGFELKTELGATFNSKKIIFATGIKDILPNLDGFSSCWGKTVIHCPYCHGYEFRGKKTALLANGEHAFHLVSLLKNLTPEVTILTQGAPDFNDEQLGKLIRNKVDIITSPIISLEHNQGSLKHVLFESQKSISFDVMYAVLPFEQHCIIPKKLGCELDEQGRIKVDNMQKTTQDNIFACGDNSSRMRSVAYATAMGNVAGAVVNMELSQENF